MVAVRNAQPKRWYKVRWTAKCEMHTWVEASSVEEAARLFDEYAYDEATPWEVVQGGEAKRGRIVRADGFVPDVDNP